MIGRSIIFTPTGDSFPCNGKADLDALDQHIGSTLCRYIAHSEFQLSKTKGANSVINKAIDLNLIRSQPHTDDRRAAFLPDGKTLLDLLRAWLREAIINVLNPVEVETPEVYSQADQLVKLQALFGESPYQTADNQILRPASDHGVLSLVADRCLEGETVRLFEMASCFRDERLERCNYLSRPSRFYMPDVHSFLSSSEVDTEIELHENLYSDLFDQTQIPFLVSVRVTQHEFDRMRDHFTHLAKKHGTDVFVNVVHSRERYWDVKFKFICEDVDGYFVQVSTIQVDYTSGMSFDIRVNTDDWAAVIHSSPGSLERWMYIIIDRFYLRSNNTVPLWLAPVQLLVGANCGSLARGRQVRVRISDNVQDAADVRLIQSHYAIPFCITECDGIYQCYSSDNVLLKEMPGDLISSIEMYNRHNPYVRTSQLTIQSLGRILG